MINSLKMNNFLTSEMVILFDTVMVMLYILMDLKSLMLPPSHCIASLHFPKILPNQTSLTSLTSTT